jgi:uncharacterized membrane protein YeaQ/YmgE (transglycosylase-associated protein family)
MSIVAYIVVGLIIGFIASKVVIGSGQGLSLDMIVGVVGAVVGAGVVHLVGQTGVDGVNPWSVFVSIIGAVVVLVVYHAFSRRRSRV